MLKTTELSTKHQGIIDNREIQKLLPVCNSKDGKKNIRFVLQTKGKTLNVLTTNGNDLQETTSISIPKLDKLVGVFQDTNLKELSSGDALVIARTTGGIVFYNLDASTSNLQLLDLDDKFSDDRAWADQLMFSGEVVETNSKTIYIVTRNENDSVYVYLLKDTDKGKQFRKIYSLPDNLEDADQFWLTQSGYSAAIEKGLYTDWIFARKGDIITSYKLSIEGTSGKGSFDEVLHLKLPKDLINSVKNIGFVPNKENKSSKFQDAIVYFKEDIAAIYRFNEGKNDFEIKSYFYGYDPTLSYSCSGENLFSVSAGLTLKSFKDAAVFEIPLRWSGDPMKPALVFSDYQNVVWLIGNSNKSNALKWYSTEVKEVEEQPYVKPVRPLGPGQDFSEVPLTAINELKLNSRVDRSILEGINSKVFTEAVSMQTGGVVFDMKLIPEIDFGIQYDSNQVGFEDLPTLGKNGWSTANLNFISMDPKSDTLDSEATFFLVLDGTVYTLEYKTTEGVKRLYKVTNSKLTEKEVENIHVSYEPNVMKWTVDTLTSHLTFGENGSAIKWDWSYRNWQKTEEKSMEKVGSEWYLTRFEKKNYNKDYKPLVLLYDYQEVTEWTENAKMFMKKEFTKAVQLVKVHSEDSNRVLIDFKYDNSHQLQSFDAKVNLYKQSVQFVYNKDDVLEEIRQQFQDDPKMQTMIKFTYDSNARKVSKVEVPQCDLLVSYQYALQNFLTLEGDVIATMEDAPANTMTTAAHSASMSVFATTNLVKAFNPADGTVEELSKLGTPSTQDLQKLNLTIHKNCVIRHGVMSRGNQIINVYCFDATQKDTKWKLGTEKSFSKDINVTVTSGGNIITSDANGNLEILEWVFKDSNFKSVYKFKMASLNEKSIFQASDNIITWYNDSTATIFWTVKKDDGWLQTPLSYKITKVGEDCSTFFKNNFDLGSELDEYFETTFSTMKFQLRGNAMAVTTCQLFNSNWKTKNRVELLVLNREGEKAYTNSFDVELENLEELRDSHKLGDKTVGFKYVKESGKFLIEAYDTANPKDSKLTKEITKQFREELAKQTSRMIIFDPKKYIGYFLSSSVFQVGTSNHIKHDGSGWVLDTGYDPEGPYSIKLGKDFIIKRTAAKEKINIFDLRNKDSLVLTEDANKIFPSYSGFVAYQDRNNTQVISFKRTAEGRETTQWNVIPDELIRGELSSSQFLVTQSAKSKNVFKIRHSGWIQNSSQETFAVQSTTVKGNHLERTVSYEYKKPRMTQSRQISFGETSLIRGGDKSKFGYITYSFDINQTYPKAYDGDGKLIEVLTPDSKENLKPKPLPKSMIFDKWNMKPITNVSPFEAKDCQVGFIGFEDYESSSVESGCAWKFDQKHVVRSGSALTGNSFLRLEKPEDVVSVEFPNKKDQSYSISTWVRVNNMKNAKPEMTSEILQAKIQPYGVTLKSKVLYVQGDWQYLEINIYPHELQSMIEKLLEKEVPEHGLTVKIEVSGDSSGSVDVDHVIFSPKSWNSEIYVYSENGEVTHNLLGNTGLIVKKLYDPIGGDAIVKTNGLGQVNHMQFETLEKSKILRCLVQFECLEEPGWIQGFQHDPLATFTPTEGSSNFKIFRNGFHSIDFSKESSLSLDTNGHESFAFRFSYSFISDNGQDSQVNLILSDREYVLKYGKKIGTKLTSNSFNNQEFSVQPSGSILFGLFKSRLIIWNPEALLWEDSNVSVLKTGKVTMSFKGDVVVENMITLPNPSLKITYFNTQAEELQVLKMVDENTVKVFENYYDPVGRAQAKTKETLIAVKPNENLLGFRPDFIKTIDIENQKMEGEVTRFNPEDGGVPFTSVIYEKGPMQEWIAEGLPGSQYAASGTFGVKFSKELDTSSSLLKLFPKEDGYKFKTKTNREGYSEIAITDKDDNIAANAVISPGSKNLLATYDYDDKGRLVTSLPPQYHEKENTLLKINNSWKKIGYAKDAPLGTFYEYDDQDNLIFKSDPDVGTFEYIYNEKTGNADFALHKASRHDPSYDYIFYYKHDGNLLTEIGELIGFDSSFKIEDLKNGSKKLTQKPIKIIEHQGRRYDPLMYTQRIISKQRDNDRMDFIQDLSYQLPHGRLASDTHVLPSIEDQPAVLIPTRFQMSPDGEKTLLTGYAVDDVTLGYSYNLLGQISQIYLVKGNLAPVTIARYEYDPSGQVKKEILLEYNTGKNQLMTPIETNVQFNSPGYPVKYSNPYFNQEINYEDNGYGDLSTGEPGYPTSTTFENLWSQNIARLSPEDLIDKSLKPKEAEVCFSALQRLGYLNDHGKILKLFRPDRDVETLPVVCSSGYSSINISKVFSKIFMERMNYGYKFQYGNMKELIKVKFMDLKNDLNTQCSAPLTPESLKVGLGISEDTSKKLWNELIEKNFLSEDKEKGRSQTLQAMSNFPLINRLAFLNDLKDKTKISLYYGQSIAYSLARRVGSAFSLEEFSKIYDGWTIGLQNETTAQEVYQLLETKAYLNQKIVQNKILNDGFIQLLKTFGLDFAKVFSVLNSYFSCEIGKSSLDMKLHDMDFNGNPKVFYSGYDRTELKYHPNTNKISLREGSKKQKIEHDSFGNLNLIRDENEKLILSIDYDKISSRPLKMELGDGRKIYFRYDYKGERVSKQVYNKSGKLEQEIKYLGRDNMGRVLVEKELTYISEALPPRTKTTTFFYGPRGLFGFLRNGKYFNVLVDNIGSTRLVLRNGEVVAAYNYLPYGQLVSKYIGSDPDGDIRYRFTGQEFDSETGLYNFHFRIYDPSIGRFYQVDPEEVFFSPYKYVGNAPIIFTDPDGREPITIIIMITLAIVGAYLGAAAVNKTWDFTKWNWTDYRTYVGLGLGALAGGLMPTGIGASFTALVPVIGTTAAVGTIVGLGTGLAYLSMASAMNDWDPTKWDYTSPELYNAAFQGFGTGAGFAGGVAGMKNAFIGFTKSWQKIAWISSSGVLAVGFGYYKISDGNEGEYRFWKWDFTRPGTYSGIVAAITTGALGPKSAKSAKDFAKTALKAGKSGIKTMSFKILVVFKRAKSYDLLKGSSTVPSTFGEIRGIRFKVLESDFTQASSAFRAVGKEDLDDLIFGTVSSFLEMVKKGIGKDFVATTSFKSITSSSHLRMDTWLENVAVTAFKRLRRSLMTNKTMNAVETSFVVTNGSLLTLPELSDFLFDGPVILLEKNQNPEIFTYLESYNFSPSAENTISEIAMENDLPAKLEAPLDNTLSELVSPFGKNMKPVSRDNLESNHFCEDLGQYSTFDGKNYHGFFSPSKLSPFMEMLPRGSNYMIPTESVSEFVNRTVITQPGWITQIHPDSVCKSKNQLQTTEFSNVTQPSSSASYRIKRSAGGDILETSSSRWNSDDEMLPPAASSGSRTTGIINYGVKILSRMWNGIFKSEQQPFESDRTQKETRDTGNFFGRKQQGEKDTSAWKSCVPWVLSEDGYVDGFTCFSSSGIVQVTPKLQTDIDQGAIMTRDSEDTYGNCNFWKGRGIGSAYCEGQKSNMHYISYIDERPFDRMNDNILFVALMLHFYQTLKSDKDVEGETDRVPIDIEKLQEWKRELESLLVGLQQLCGQTKDEFYHDWAFNLLEDRMMDVEQFKKDGSISPDAVQEFEDNLSALRDEICEGYFLSDFQ